MRAERGENGLEAQKKVVLIDGHSILNRAFYGVPELTNSAGLHTNAVYGFLNILLKLLEEERARFKQIEPELRAHRIHIEKKMHFNEHGLFLNAAGAQYYAKLRRLAIESGVFDSETVEGKVCGLEDFWPEKVVCCARIIQCSDLTHV